jgi:hypothetical protein
MQTNSDQFKEILDIIFKWSFVKLNDSSNTQFAVKIFDFFGTVIQHLEDT